MARKTSNVQMKFLHWQTITNFVRLSLLYPNRNCIPQVKNAIERVRAAGVRVMMVTGDHPATARAVAQEVGIATTPNCHVVTGNDLRNMTPDLLYLTLEKHYEIGKIVPSIQIKYFCTLVLHIN